MKMNEIMNNKLLQYVKHENYVTYIVSESCTNKMYVNTYIFVFMLKRFGHKNTLPDTHRQSHPAIRIPMDVLIVCGSLELEGAT